MAVQAVNLAAAATGGRHTDDAPAFPHIHPHAANGAQARLQARTGQSIPSAEEAAAGTGAGPIVSMTRFGTRVALSQGNRVGFLSLSNMRLSVGVDICRGSQAAISHVQFDSSSSSSLWAMTTDGEVLLFNTKSKNQGGQGGGGGQKSAAPRCRLLQKLAAPSSELQTPGIAGNFVYSVRYVHGTYPFAAKPPPPHTLTLAATAAVDATIALHRIHTHGPN